jgi:hypothetical protein
MQDGVLEMESELSGEAKIQGFDTFRERVTNMRPLKQMSVKRLKALETTIFTETTNEPDPLEKTKLSLLLWVVQCVLVNKCPVPTHSDYRGTSKSVLLSA